MNTFKNIKVAVTGMGYVGLSIATLLAQHHQVTAVDVVPEKVEINELSPLSALSHLMKRHAITTLSSLHIRV